MLSMRFVFLFAFTFFLAFQAVAEVTLDAPEAAPAGSEIKVSFTGGESADFISIVSVGSPEGTYNRYQYAKRNPVTLTVPDLPGEYEIRYLAADRPYPTLAVRPLKVTPVNATLQAPEQVPAGSDITIHWTGPDNKQDYITIVASGAKEGSYGTYVYTKKGSPLTLKAPDKDGRYELRYAMGVSYKTVVSRAIQVIATTATLEAPATVSAGSPVQVTWTGPNNPQDYITIVPKGAKEGAYDDYKYTKSGSTLTLTAPDFSGEYEVRYSSGQDSLTLASHALTVTATSANIQSADSIVSGAKLEITWEGPGNPLDYILIAEADANDKAYESFVYTKSGNPLTLTVPELPGDYEVRYATGKSDRILARKRIKALPATASLQAPDTVEIRSAFSVAWEGPGNELDYIAVLPASADNYANGPYAMVKRGKTLTLDAPNNPGNYEVRYITGKLRNTLASRPISVIPGKEPGTLLVLQSKGTENYSPAIAVILDASGSMLKKMADKRRIDIAKQALIHFTQEALSEGDLFALRVFGHKEADSCRTDLEVPLAPLNKAKVIDKVGRINAKNLAKTPIAASLRLVSQDLTGATGPHLVVLLTDGEETCEGDPAEVISRLRNKGIDVRVNIIGFGIEERMLRDTFAEWAKLGGGNYFDARDAQELNNSMLLSTQRAYDVLDKDGGWVASGTVNGEPIKLAAGSYRLRFSGSEPADNEPVIIQSGEKRVVER